MQALRLALNSAKYAYKAPESAVDYIVVGGGVVGLAIARKLSQLENQSTILIERHNHAGEETSSRNSEVIHSGLYYPPDSLKTRLCIRGRELLYRHCITNNVPFRRTGKLVVATQKQLPYIESLHAKARKLEWPYPLERTSDGPALPTQLLSGSDARLIVPDLSKEIAGALWCPESGVVDSHSLMESFEKDIIDSESADLVYSTRAVRVDPFVGPEIDGTKRGWVVQTMTGGECGESGSILTKTLINATGLSTPMMVNSLLPEAKRIPMFYARGSYAKYYGPGIEGAKVLIYPCPEIKGNAHGFQSLGTHLTIDMQGQVRFGPDLQWIWAADGQDANFWKTHLVPDDSRLTEMYEAVAQYLPNVRLEGFKPDYVGIRPKAVGPGGGFADFVFRDDYPDADRESLYRPMISLLGIESPGLTASLAIAEYLVKHKLEHVHGGR